MNTALLPSFEASSGYVFYLHYRSKTNRSNPSRLKWYMSSTPRHYIMLLLRTKTSMKKHLSVWREYCYTAPWTTCLRVYSFSRLFFGDCLLSSLGEYSSRSPFQMLNVFLTGEQHRHQRKILNPGEPFFQDMPSFFSHQREVFNINHMRYMTPIFYRVSQKVRCFVMSRTFIHLTATPSATEWTR